MSNGEWRPKVGEEVMVRGVVMGVAEEREDSVLLQMDGTKFNEWFWPDDLSPAPAPAPREPWEVLREAAVIVETHQPNSAVTTCTLRRIADELEATARPAPPPTLAEAVRAAVEAVDPHYSSWQTITKALADVKEALARAEAGQ